jgi:hypothetical protein
LRCWSFPGDMLDAAELREGKFITGGGNVDREEAADVAGVVGAPRHADILLRHGDRLLIADSEGYAIRYQVVGERLPGLHRSRQLPSSGQPAYAATHQTRRKGG